MNIKPHFLSVKTDKPPVVFRILKKDAFRVCLLLILSAFFLSGCKTSRKTASSKTASGKINIVSDADAGTASSSKISPASPKTKSSGPANRFPAQEYYGDRWNTEHVRISSDPKPSGTITLDMTPAGTAGFVMPFCGKTVSEFGPRNGRMHTGIDIKLEMNDPVYCAFDGMVRMAKNYGNYGKMVAVRHDNGLETLYSHLNSIAVKQNQRVKAGDRIGGGGKTGNAQGEHLHFETRFKGEPFNPRLVVDFEKCKLKSETLALNDKSYTLYYKNLQASTPEAAQKREPEKTTKPLTQTASAQTDTKQTPHKPTEHIVEKGDTLYSISRRYGTTVDTLRKLNQLTESAILEIGQKIAVR